jgi:hypothetical protein
VAYQNGRFPYNRVDKWKGWREMKKFLHSLIVLTAFVLLSLTVYGATPSVFLDNDGQGNVNVGVTNIGKAVYGVQVELTTTEDLTSPVEFISQLPDVTYRLTTQQGNKITLYITSYDVLNSNKTLTLGKLKNLVASQFTSTANYKSVDYFFNTLQAKDVAVTLGYPVEPNNDDDDEELTVPTTPNTTTQPSTSSGTTNQTGTAANDTTGNTTQNTTDKGTTTQPSVTDKEKVTQLTQQVSALTQTTLLKTQRVLTHQAQTLGDVGLVVNGKKVTLTDKILAEYGRTMLPIRTVAEIFGLEIGYNAASKTAIIVKDGHTIEFPLGLNVAIVDGEKTVPIDATNTNVKIVAAQGRTYLPIRFIGEQLGLKISYSQKTVFIHQ